MRRFLAAAALLGLLAGGVTTTAGAQADPARSRMPRDAVDWGPCKDPNLAAKQAQCGFVTVPLDYGRPDGTKIKLAVSRIKHTVPEAAYQGVMLVNPGGPGGSGLPLSVLGALVPDNAGAAYDWIGFDPRGVGSSVPELTCDSDYFGYDRPSYVPSTALLERTWRTRAAAYARSCATAGGALLDHLRTTDNARDLESIRVALGQQQINYYGFSYGTYLGQVYATMFPHRVRRMVLDGNVNPHQVWYAANLDQDAAFDRNMQVYFGWLAKYDAYYHLGKTAAAVNRVYYRTQAELTRKPAGGAIGPDELTDVFLQAGYYIFGWEDLADAFADLVTKKDPAKLKAMYDKSQAQTPGNDNNYAIYLATQCTDARWPLNWRKWKNDNWRLHRAAPFETWGNAWYNAPCLNWAAKPAQPVQVNGTQAPPILLISETRDAATPYAGSLAVRKLFPRSALIEGVGGTTHAGSLFGNKCVDGTIATYLANGSLPARVKADHSDKQCQPIAQPDPGKQDVKSRAPAPIRPPLAPR
jgi:pimeloyl-ACP methyl ester carboxylesterase